MKSSVDYEGGSRLEMVGEHVCRPDAEISLACMMGNDLSRQEMRNRHFCTLFCPLDF